MDDALISPDSSESPGPPRHPRDGNTAALVSAVLAGVGSLYACTHSVAITAIAVGASITLAYLTRR